MNSNNDHLWAELERRGYDIERASNAVRKIPGIPSELVEDAKNEFVLGVFTALKVVNFDRVGWEAYLTRGGVIAARNWLRREYKQRGREVNIGRLVDDTENGGVDEDRNYGFDCITQTPDSDMPSEKAASDELKTALREAMINLASSNMLFYNIVAEVHKGETLATLAERYKISIATVANYRDKAYQILQRDLRSRGFTGDEIM